MYGAKKQWQKTLIKIKKTRKKLKFTTTILIIITITRQISNINELIYPIRVQMN